MVGTPVTLDALSIPQPFSWAIANGFCPLVNRGDTAPTGKRFLIHAGKKERDELIAPVLGWIADATMIPIGDLRARYAAERGLGAIVGAATIRSIVRIYPKPWWRGPFAYVVEDAKPCQPITFRGRPGFFPAAIEWHDLAPRPGK